MAVPEAKITAPAERPVPPVFPRLIRAAHLESDHSQRKKSDGFTLASLRGCPVEISSSRPSAGLSLSCSLLLEAQRSSLPAAWISLTRDSFYPPDLAANGVKLSILPVVWVPDVRSAGRTADWLLRTGAFGLLVVDLYGSARPSAAQQARLAQLAHRHGSTVCFLTVKPEPSPSMGSMICLYVRDHRSRIDSGRFRLSLEVLKDKRRAPVWEHVEHVDGPPGLR
jgi:recombination protein RecA